jgi:cytochrome c oxidase cbb3-type subunit 3/ubiquinol-cytochrome c reductase cytochrome c subunit
VEQGRTLFASACSQCHGANGKGSAKAGAVNDSAFLTLMSDQALRRIVITGRPDLGMPDYRHQDPKPESKPLTSQDISDLVALLVSWRKTP